MSDERELKDQRIPIMMTEKEVTAIDDWSFKHRIRSRGEAIRRLCQIGLVFDDHRAEYVERFKSILDAASAISPLARRAANRIDESTDLERAAMAAGVTTLIEVMKMFDLVRTTTGLANNFKSDKEIEDIISEAKEILAANDPGNEV
ncbi:hypothetical protein [Rhizobium leguminosarum]|uniref:hypothetical protein n=1 Tax=Rhizobium leguminosarum TaxID=384 RepID=UPI003F99B032